MGIFRRSTGWALWLPVLALWACGDEGPIDTGPPPFEVVGVDPDDGMPADSVVAPVQLILSAIPELSRCNTDTIRVDAVLDDGTVAFNSPFAFDLQSEGNLKLKPDDPYIRGYTYAVTVRGGETGCADLNGRAILPFYSTFEVP